ncbi:hypothetical protein Cs7R123_42160 [Catellatospora sp. TT07R-123]|uniref:DUF3103 family protein n=1 Tax=Catellatospora sp. TT07R-123 TaxID=2733863 RepID=UPI001B1E9EE7|nr:DUF3103 family protein [Catellatospora sp. TT07R-123]GHJ46874.1 hypothetical protein Cs7R123_42160 [Catellatospora sp. TT07R-123]
MQLIAPRRILPVAAAALLALSLPTPAGARPDTAAGPQTTPTTVAATLDGLAHRVALALADRDTRTAVTSAVQAGPVTLAGVARLHADAAAADRAVLAAKGLPASLGAVTQLRLALPQMRAALARGQAPLVATAPTDDTATAITAYDPSGRTVLLDPARAPQQPVLVVEVDSARTVPAGLDLVRHALAQRGVAPAGPAAALSGGYWATKVNAVRLSDDEEPWIKGAAEIYSIVGGFGLDGHPKVDIVQMPYLDYDGTTYYPNQLLVHFSAYKYNLADVVMMEDDGDTNYQSLAQAIATALLTITDQGVYIPLVNAIINAIPTSWWTDDPDYVDSWYTLTTGSSGHLNGAAANGWIEVSPYWVAPL